MLLIAISNPPSFQFFHSIHGFERDQLAQRRHVGCSARSPKPVDRRVAESEFCQWTYPHRIGHPSVFTDATLSGHGHSELNRISLRRPAVSSHAPPGAHLSLTTTSSTVNRTLLYSIERTAGSRSPATSGGLLRASSSNPV